MAELDASLLGPVQRGPSQRQFRKGSLKPTSHLMRLARSNAQKVVNVLEDVNETLLRKHAPRIARRRSGSWVPASQEAARASINAQPRLRRTSSVQMEVGSMAERYSSNNTARRPSQAQGALTRSSQAALARKYSTRGARKSSLFFTDSINVTTGGRKPHQLSIQIQRAGNGPLKYTVSVPNGTRAAVEGSAMLRSTDRDTVTVFHDPFASERARGNVNITIDLRDRRSRYVPGPADGGSADRRSSKSLPASPTSSMERLHEMQPLSGQRERARKSTATARTTHRRNLSHNDQPGYFDTKVRHSIRTPQFLESAISPSTREMRSPGQPPAVSPRSLGSPTVSVSSLSPGPRTPTIAEALSAQAKDTDSIITTSSFGSNVMSYLRRSSSRGSRAVSLHSTANGPVPDLISVRSTETGGSAISPISEVQPTEIDDETEVSVLTPVLDRHRRSSSDTVISRDRRGRRSSSRQEDRRPSTTLSAPLHTFYDARVSTVSNDAALDGAPEKDDAAAETVPGGLRISTLSTARSLESRSSTPVPSPWNDYLGFCAGAFWAQAGLAGAMLRKRGAADTLAATGPHAQRTHLACSNRRCGFTARDADPVPLLEARGVRVRPRFLVKSHVEQAGGGVPLFRCMLCALAQQAAGVIQGVDALLAHLGGHGEDAGALGADVLREAHCIAGRRAGEYEGFDVNLLPAAARDSTLSDSLLSPAGGLRYLSGFGAGEAGGREGVSARTGGRQGHEMFFDH